VANIETDPVGDRYTLRGDGTWPNTDTAQYAFDGNDEVVDDTPENTDDDTLEVSVRLLYVVNTREYVEFLADANKTNNAGMDVLGLFEDAGFAQPIELATTNVSIPITGFGAAGESSSSSGGPSADTSSSGGSANPDTGPDPVTRGSDESTSAMADDDGGGGGCECRTSSSGAPWLLLPFVVLVRRRQPKRSPSTNLRHAASKRSMSRS
jgi:hypothetical protein